jgi:hypothetical protein
MAELTFTQREIDDLTERLGALAANLSRSQGLLLMAIFAAGVDSVERVPQGGTETSSVPADNPAPAGSGDPASAEGHTASDAQHLRNQLRQSFVPGGPPPPRPLVIRVRP